MACCSPANRWYFAYGAIPRREAGSMTEEQKRLLSRARTLEQHAKLDRLAINAVSEDLAARREARGDVVVTDWATGAGLYHDGDVIPFPQSGHRRL
jgi:hypothetical protein